MRAKLKVIELALLAVIGSLSFGCTDASGPVTEVAANLPAAATQGLESDQGGDCAEGQKHVPVPLCDWFGAADDIVWGTVTAVRFPTRPTVRQTVPDPPNPVGKVVDNNCEPAIGGQGIEFDVALDASLKGVAPQLTTIRAGFRYRVRMVPKPVLKLSGTRVSTISPDLWPALNDGTSPFQDNVAVDVGRRFGFPIHRIAADDSFSLLGETIFHIDDDGRVRSQPMDSMDFTGPSEIEDLPVEELPNLVAACPAQSESALARKRAQQVGYGPEGYQKELWYTAAWCDHNIADIQVPAGRCYADLDCNDTEEFCNECAGTCHPLTDIKCQDARDCAEGQSCNECSHQCESPQ